MNRISGTEQLVVANPSIGDPRSGKVSPWSPLRSTIFRSLWLAVLFSNIGTWMQAVGAQWLLVNERNASTLVALVQTASTLPIVLLALPAGALADSFDRRRMLIAAQTFQVSVGAGLTILTLMGHVHPAMLLIFTAGFGIGQAMTAPAYQALIPEIVGRHEVRSASALGAVAMNVGRAIGPAIAGLLIAHASVSLVFALNAVSYAVFAIVLCLWRPPESGAAQSPERFLPAMRAGGRYIRHSPVVRRVIFRVVLFVVPAMTIWALLPLVATRELHMGAGGYGVLLGALGVGAIGATVMLPRLRNAWSENRIIAFASLAYAGAALVIGYVHVAGVALIALLFAGASWLTVVSSLNSSLQLFLPRWVRGRGLAVYQTGFFGAQAGGAFAWGLVAETVSLGTTFFIGAVLMALAGVSIVRWPLRDVRGMAREPAVFWEDPDLSIELEDEYTPVLVTTTYRVDPSVRDEFVSTMEHVRRSKLRTGATRWELYEDGENPGRYVEAYSVASWDEHMRQHSGRLTEYDRLVGERARNLSDPAPTTSHLFPVQHD